MFSSHRGHSDDHPVEAGRDGGEAWVLVHLDEVAEAAMFWNCDFFHSWYWSIGCSSKIYPKLQCLILCYLFSSIIKMSDAPGKDEAADGDEEDE